MGQGSGNFMDYTETFGKTLNVSFQLEDSKVRFLKVSKVTQTRHQQFQ